MKLKTRKIDISTLDRDGLLDLKSEVWEELMEIKIGLDKAQRKFRREGILADPDWFDMNEERRMLLAIDVGRIDRLLRKTKPKAVDVDDYIYGDDDSVYRIFYERAAELLPAELFSKIVEQV